MPNKPLINTYYGRKYMKDIISSSGWRIDSFGDKKLHNWIHHCVFAAVINRPTGTSSTGAGWKTLGLMAMTTFLLIFGAPAFAAKDMSVKLGIENTGVYRVTYEELGLTRPVKSKKVALTNQGEPVALLLNDGDDGWFGPADSLSFVGQHLAGDNSYFNEFSRYNVYRFEQDRRQAKRLQPLPPVELDASPGSVRTRQHLERDKLRVRFNSRQSAPEVWYWERLSQIDKQPFIQLLDLGAQPGSVSLKVAVQGWSRPNKASTQDLSDHRSELYFDDELIDSLEFASQESGLFNVVIPAVSGGEHTLKLRVPTRRAKGEENDIVDVILLNYIEVEFDYWPDPMSQTSFHTLAQGGQVAAPAASTLYGNGQYWLADKPFIAVLPPETQWQLAPKDEQFSVAWVATDQPSRLMSRRNRADYLMISHPSLIEAIRPLAEFHRARGLDVAVIDVTDIYDEFNHGIVSPYAIRDFISHAYSKWRGRPEFVLLVGDASWDVHNEEANDKYYADHAYRGRKINFVKNGSTSYADTGDRNLLPTFSVETYDGLAASDNVFVAVDGDDFKPDLAIGRFPVVTPKEVTAIVDKLIAYASLSEVGPWRRNILWITNEQRGFQRISDQLASKAAADGFSATKIYPAAEEKDNSEHQAQLTQAFNDGQLLVHFLGHGGRYIWRTGPPDIRKNHDLFTLDHVEQLAPSNKLPMILSMTCYSAPFDHPTADSIGEKFLRLPDRGAMAVFAASWRNSPGRRFSQLLVDQLTQPGQAIGKAIMLAKQDENSRIMVETYNLLGDPAAQLAIPSKQMVLNLSDRGDWVGLSGSVATDHGGRFIVDWLDAEGEVLKSEEKASESGKFDASLAKANLAPHSARVYFWNADTGIDAFGTIQLQARNESGR